MFLKRTLLLVPLALCLGLMIGCSGNETGSPNAGGGGEPNKEGNLSSTVDKVANEAEKLEDDAEKVAGEAAKKVADKTEQGVKDAEKKIVKDAEKAIEKTEQAVDKAVEKVKQEAQELTGAGLDLRYVTDDFTSAVIVHPARVLNSEFMNELVKAGLPLEEALKEPIEETGIDFRKVEQVMILVDKDSAQAAPSMLPLPFGPPGGQPGGFEAPAVEEEQIEKEAVPEEKSDQGALDNPPAKLQPVAFQPAAGAEGVEIVEEGFGPAMAPPIPTLITRFSEDINPTEFFDKFNGPPMEDAEVDGLKVKMTSFPPAAFYFVDSKTLIFTQPKFLKKMVDTKSAESDLITELKRVDPNHDLIIVADLMPFRPQLQQLSPFLAMMVPPDKGAFGTIPTKTKILTITGGISHDSLLSLSLLMDTPDDAAAVNAAVTDGLQQVRQIYELQKGQGLPPEVKLSDEDQKQVLQMADEIVNGITNKVDGNRLTVTVPKPGNFNKLPELMKPAIEQAKQAAALSRQRNQLKQIGLAFHNYHDIYNTFPAAGADARGTQGLSWRVHLLPMLGEVPLYNQFHLDEPWDSEHNKKLIAQMPNVYQTPEVTDEGKTAFCVIVDEKAAFQMEKGRTASEFLDGLSNTILVVRAGPDKAEIWTRPGGLKFNQENPIAAFGKIGETFQALIADGSVRAISRQIPAETLKALITHNVGDPVGDF